jgi:acyl carrier protein
MNEVAVYAKLTEIFNELFFRDDIALKPEIFANDIDGWDSYKYVEIMLTVEERFGVTIQSREIDSLRCIGDLVTLLMSKLKV